MIKVRKYVSLRDVVYPRYSVIEFSDKVLSGLRSHRLHLYINGKIFGAFLQGIIGVNIETINVIAETIPEYIIFFFNCMISVLFLKFIILLC
jgi:hypothetical protein